MTAFTVTTYQDNGVHPVFNSNNQYIGVAPNTPVIDGSLTRAIWSADQQGGSNTIDFSIGSGPQTIAPSVPWDGGGPYPMFPIVTCQLTIDGTTQPGDSGQPLITLSEAGEGNDTDGGSWDGLEIAARGCVVKGLKLDGFGNAYNADYGVAIRVMPRASGAIIEGNSIGSGVVDESGGGNTIGGTANTAGNDFYGAGVVAFGTGFSLGLETSGTTGDLIEGNAFLSGIAVSSVGHTIGGTVAGSGNMMSGAFAIDIDLESGSSGILVEGNLIGTNAGGTVGVGNRESGILVDGATNSTIGGTTAAARNVISGNWTGIEMDDASGIVAEGNYIGLDITGKVAVGNLEGIAVNSSNDITIGGMVSGSGNVISGNPNGGLEWGGVSNVLLAGNRIGTDASGTATLPNSPDLDVEDVGPGFTIGGTTAAAGNVLAGGMALDASDVLIEGNHIGVTTAGVPLDNPGDGMWIWGTGNTIGGTTRGAGNVIADNGSNGVDLVYNSPDNAILGNSIYGNGILGINQNGGGDDLQPAPALTSASIDTATSTTTVLGMLQAAADTTFRVEFFSNTAPDPSNHYEGQAYVAAVTVTTDANGNASIAAKLPLHLTGGLNLTATATDPNGNTSQFSNAVLTPTVHGNTATNLTVTVNPSVHGESIGLTAGVAAVASGAPVPTGSVTFTDGSTTLGTINLSGGSATYTTAKLATGQHTITATYNGTWRFAASTSAALGQMVNQDGSSTAVTASVNPSVYGQSVTFTATVVSVAPGSGTPTGSVTFLDGSTPMGTGTLAGGKASFKTASLAVGSQSITAVYRGDGNFTGSTSTALNQSVNQDATTTSLKSSVNPSVYGQSVTFTATVKASAPGSGTLTGSVTFYDGTTSLGKGGLNGSGVATFATSGLSVGAHAITAVYGGGGDFTTSTSAAVTQGVNQASTKATLASSANPATSGQSVTFTATIAPVAPGSGTPTGIVTFEDGTTTLGVATLSGGRASFTTATLSVGTHSITAVYGGESRFAASTSAILKQVIHASSGQPAAVSAGPVGDQVLGTLVEEAPASGSLEYELTLEQVTATGRRSRKVADV